MILFPGKEEYPYKTLYMQKLNRKTQPQEVLPTKILQFGGGNFLRGFIDFFIDKYNQSTGENLGISVVKVTPGSDYSEWREQDGLYHVLSKGILDGELVSEKYLVTCISKIIHCYNEWVEYILTARNRDIEFIISNTTESGLQLSEKDDVKGNIPHSFPAKLTFWLYERFQYFKNEPGTGCIIIPCELLENNGQILKDLILTQSKIWGLEAEFREWIENKNIFCNTLVDRIVPGVHQDNLKKTWQEIGCEDHLVTEGEPYHIFVIEAPEIVEKKLPLYKAGLNVVFTDDLQPYRQRKVRILNGAHTALVPVAYLGGIRIVRDAINDKYYGKFLTKIINDEILPSLDMPKEELDAYAKTIIDRFSNPYIDHYLIDISLNSFSKFKARLLPSLKKFHEKKGKIPALIPFAFTCMILFYKGKHNQEEIKLRDEPVVIDKMKSLWASENDFKSIIHEVLIWEEFWGLDLTSFEGLQQMMNTYMEKIVKDGVLKALKPLI